MMQARELMTCAFDSGINFFDTAEAYMSGEAETIMGTVFCSVAKGGGC